MKLQNGFRTRFASHSLWSVSEPFAARAEQEGIGFALENPPVAVQVWGIESHLRAAVENLLDNAVKFTPAGGEIQVRLSADPGVARLAIQDTGIGIPQQGLPRVGHRFSRSGNAAAYPGSGLGPTIVRAVARRDGGWMRAENGTWGTCLTITLPVEQG